MTKDQIEAFCSILFNNFQPDEKVLGAWLGGTYKAVVGRRVKDDFYGGIEDLVAVHFSDCLRPDEVQGMDRLFRLSVKEGDVSFRTTQTDDSSLWDVFSNPKATGSIFVHPRGGELSVSRMASSPPGGFDVLQRMTPEDYLQLVEMFCKDRNIIVEDIPGIKDTDGSPHRDFWNNWKSYVNDKALLPLWGKYRIEQILQFFRDRLAKINIPKEQSEKHLQTLQSQHALRRKRLAANGSFTQKQSLESHDPQANDGGVTPRDPGVQKLQTHPHASVDIRHLARQALDQMSLEEIRALRLPLGIVIDLLSRPS